MSTAKSVEVPDPERELAAAIERKDWDRALTILMEHFGGDVYRSALSRTGDEHLAEDIRQQVFLEAYRDLGQLSGPDAARAWLLGITRHRSLDAVKARTRWWQSFKNAPREPADDEGEQLGVESVPSLRVDPAEMLDSARLVKVLKQCLERLTPAIRESVTLCYMQSLSHEKVAKVVGAQAGAVQKRISRAMLALRTCINRRISGGVK